MLNASETELAETASEGLSEKEFAKFKLEFANNLAAFADNLVRWAPIYVRMSSAQRLTVKRMARGIVEAKKLDLLPLVASGKLSPTVFQVAADASVVRRLPEKARQASVDPDRVVEVLTKRGAVVKKIADLNRQEWKQVVDSKKGILTAKEQHDKNWPQQAGKAGKAGKAVDSMFVFDGMLTTREGELIVYGRDKDDLPGSRTIAIRVPKSQVGKLLN